METDLIKDYFAGYNHHKLDEDIPQRAIFKTEQVIIALREDKILSTGRGTIEDK